jgi:prolyl oligopeptidase
MKKLIISVMAIGLIFVSCNDKKDKKKKKDWKQSEISYPKTNKIDSVTNYFGTEVNDPYAWLENDTSAATEAWVKAENKTTFEYLNNIPFRDKIKDRYEKLFNYEKVSAPRKEGDHYFMEKNDGLQDQSVIYYKKGEDGDWQVFMDPNKMSKDGTVTVGLLQASKNGKYIAYRYSEAGSDWGEIRIREIETNTDLTDIMKWVKFSGASWYKNGFFYSRYPAPKKGTELSSANRDHRLYYHELGTKQSDDVLIYQNKENDRLYVGADITEDKEYLLLYIYEGTENGDIYYKKANDWKGEFKPLITGFIAKSYVVDHTDGRFLLYTNLEAPNNRLVAVDTKDASSDIWVDIIAEDENYLDGVSTGGNQLFASYLVNATTRIFQMDYHGQNRKEIKLPGTGSASGFSGKNDEYKLFYSFTSFLYPNTIFEYNVKSGESVVYYQANIDFNPEDYVEEQHWFTSKDGTKVPMFIVHKKGLKLDGKNPTLLYAYGGFNISLTPYFSTSRIILLENGGVFALANLRGGGEFGEAWHQEGMLMNKQNVFDDFIAAANYLIDKGYTSKKKLAIEGGSNGGLLVGACITQKPKLFKVAFPAVGVMDMLKYHKFTVGWGWTPEYGSSEDSKEMFEYLYGYSPYHNIKDKTKYPATMITTADHDDRVVPAHSFKFAARMQEAQKGKNPILIRIETRAGHGAGKPTSKIIEEQADKWAFMFYNMKYTDLYPDKK